MNDLKSCTRCKGIFMFYHLNKWYIYPEDDIDNNTMLCDLCQSKLIRFLQGTELK